MNSPSPKGSSSPLRKRPSSSLFRTKDIDELIAHANHPDHRLKKTLGPWSLMALGIGAIIGSGIFVLTGTAAAGETLTHNSLLNAPLIDILLHGTAAVSTYGRPGAGPAISLSFILVAIACAFAGLCYAELASMIPIAGSAYTYAYATLGEIFAWVLGWDLILEYAVSNMAVAVGFSAYFNDILDSLFGVHLPPQLSGPIFAEGVRTGNWFNLPAFLIIMALTVPLVWGIRESASANNIMVLVKMAAIAIFVIGAAKAVNVAHYHPFAPSGAAGVMTGAAIVFFSYIGFDSVSTAAEECGDPHRDLPVGILGSLAVCTVLYVSVALVLTGLVDYKTLNNAAPVANALKALGMNNLRRVVSLGAITGMISSLLVFQYGQARVWFAMSRDRLLPPALSHIHPRFKTPSTGTWVAGWIVAIGAAIFDIGTLADLTNIGTLFAFALVSWGVIRLRKTQPDRRRAFRVPLVPLTPIISIVMCVVLMASLPLETWIRFFVWLAIGLIIYFGYSRRHVSEAPAA